MKAAFKEYSLVLCVFLLSHSAVLGDPPCTITWKGGYDTWDDTSKWEPSRVPTSSDNVCILQVQGQYQSRVEIFNADAVAESIWVDEDSQLEIYGAWKLTITDDSYIDGVFEICQPIGGHSHGGKLVLGDSLTIAPSGSTGPRIIKMLFAPDAIIEAAPSSGAVLTIGSGLNIVGTGNIKLPVVNNGKIAASNSGVWGSTDIGRLSIEAGGSGSGTWASQSSVGRLHIINTEITGNGTWELIDHASAKIEVDVALPCLEGAVNITKGTLDVDQNFHTEGQLDITGMDSLIDVTGGKHAKFSLPNLSCLE